MRHVMAVTMLCMLVVGVSAERARASEPPPITVGPDTNGDGWIFCHTAHEGQRYAFVCPVFPAGGTRAAIGGWWAAAKCAAGIVAFIAGNVVAIAKIRKAGGVWKAAKKIIKAKGSEARAKVIAAIFGDLLGLAE